MPSDVLYNRIQARLKSRLDRNILRRLSDPTDLIDFSSNDYLGLSKSHTLRQQFLRALVRRSSILGSGGSRLLDGNTPEHIHLERRLAQFFNAPAALLYGSGYDANVGFFSCVPQRGDTVIYDALIHASVHDGMRASRIPSVSRIPFQHNSIEFLQSTIESLMRRDDNLANGLVCLWVAVESLYSMDGDIAPLHQIIDLVEKMCPLGNGHVIVDEAHSTGIHGPDGRGLVAMANLEDRVLVRLHTFGKSLASNGGMCPSYSLLGHSPIPSTRDCF
jgi:8-amino-7-oxononanoate synthase